MQGNQNTPQNSQPVAKEDLYQLLTGDLLSRQNSELRAKIDEFISTSQTQSLKECSEQILSTNNVNIYSGLNRIRNIISQTEFENSSHPHLLIQSIINLPCFDKICNIASDGMNLFKYEALWILGNIGVGNQNQCDEVIKRKGAQIFANNVKSDFDLIVDVSAYCIGNYSADPAFRRALVQQNVIEPLLQFAQKQKFKRLDFWKTAVWALSNIARCTTIVKDNTYKKLPSFFSKIIKENDDEEMLSNVLRALSKHSEREQEINSIFETGVVPKFIILLQSPEKEMCISTIRIIGNLLTGDDDIVDILLRLEVIKIFQQLLDNKDKDIVRQVCWCLSNIAAGSTSSVKKIVTNNSLMLKLSQLVNQQNIKYNWQINWIFSNALEYGDLEDIDYAIDLGLLQCIKKLLTQSSNHEQQAKTLKGIEELLKKTQQSKGKIKLKIITDKALAEIIEELQYHSSKAVYNQALKILDKFQILKKKQ